MANVTSIERLNEHTRIEHLDDGTHRVTLQRGQHYFDRDTGRYEASDSNIYPDQTIPGFTWNTKAGSARARLAPGGRFRFGLRHPLFVTYRPRGAQPVTPIINGHTAYFFGLWPSVNLELTRFPEGVKEDLRLLDASAPSSYVWDLEELAGVVPTPAADGGLDYVEILTGQVVGRVPAPTVHDAAGVQGPATMTYAAGALTIAIDPAWLADAARVWPVTLDPTTVTIQPDPATGKDAYCTSGDAVNYGAETILVLGGPNSWGLLQFVLSAPPPGSASVNATLSLYHTYANNTDTNYSALFRAHSLDAAWDETTVSGNMTPSHGSWKSAATTLVTYATLNTWVSWDITALVTSWLNGSRINNGVGLWDEKTSYTLIVQFPSSDYTVDATKRPKLIYTYTTSTITATSPNGAQAAPALTADDVSPLLSGQYNNTDAVNMNTKRHQVYDEANNLVWDSGDVAQVAASGATVTAAVPGGLLQYGRAYWWRWLAKDANGGITPWTAAAWFQPVMSAPTGLTATADAANARVNLAWTAHTGENLAGYRVYRRKQGGAAWTLLNQSLANTNSYVDSAAVSGQFYDYAVSAVATDGYESPLSAAVTGSVTYADTWIDDVKLSAPALTDQTVPFLGSVVPVHGKTAPVVFGRQTARRRTLAGTADGSQAMAELELALAAGQTHRYADPAQAFRFLVVGDLRAQRTYPVTDANGNAMEQFDWSVDVVEVA